jgi:hypothetical protein
MVPTRLGIAAIERVRIVRSPASLTYGRLRIDDLLVDLRELSKCAEGQIHNLVS